MSLYFLSFYVIIIIQSKKKVKGRDIMDGIYVLIPSTGNIIYYDSVYDYLLDRVDVEDVLDLIDEIELPIDIPYYGEAMPSTILKKFNAVGSVVDDLLDSEAIEYEYELKTNEYITMNLFDSINGEIISYDEELLKTLR